MKPVTKTAYYCCGIRMLDAQSAKPLVNDVYAEALMGEEGLTYFEPFRKHQNPNATNIARCFIFDGWVRDAIKARPDTTVILIGAGLDTKAFRIEGGNWIELDEAGVIEYKNSKLPVSNCSNPLQRIAINFGEEHLRDKLAPFTHLDNVVFLIEGVLMYVTNNEKTELLKTLTSMFKKHVLMCDLMSKTFFDEFGSKGIYSELLKSNTPFKDMIDQPEKMIMDAGYALDTSRSNPIAASDYGLVSIPRFIVTTFMEKRLKGYSSYKFSYEP